VLLTGFPECERLWTLEDVDGMNGSPWTLDRVREWTVMVECFFYITDVTYD
jgi:hypothetical protein